MRIPVALFMVALACSVAVVGGRVAAQDSVSSAFCGDGIVDPGEECDPGIPDLTDPDLGGKTCASEGYTGGELACTPAGPHGAGCTLDRSDCVCRSVGPPAPVAKTGQTTCWDVQGSPIDCVRSGQDGEYQKGVAADPRFTDNGDGTVTDNLTGLIWLKKADCLDEPRSWAAALIAASELSDGVCGLTDGSAAGDWRLPNVRELQSLIDYGHTKPALPPGHPFTGVESSIYTWYRWSSTTNVAYRNYAWVVGFNYGYVLNGSNGKSGSYWMWPVRGGE